MATTTYRVLANRARRYGTPDEVLLVNRAGIDRVVGIAAATPLPRPGAVVSVASEGRGSSTWRLTVVQGDDAIPTSIAGVPALPG